MMPSPRPRSTRQAHAGLQYAFGSVARANPLVIMWRWRYELIAVASLIAPWAALGVTVGAAITGGLAVVLAGVLAWSGTRRQVLARIWCIVTPHRVRVGCAQAWIHSRYGKLPVILATTREPFGERVYLWCRAGTSVQDLYSARELLAAACWADDIRVSRDPKYAHLVLLDVIRQGEPVGPDDSSPPPEIDAADDCAGLPRWPWRT
jgi:hypothetical protein